MTPRGRARPPAPASDIGVVPASVAPTRKSVAAILERPLAVAFMATLGVLGALVLGTALGSITTILVYVVLALFVALGLDPVVRVLERRGMKRGAGIGLVFGVFALLVACFLVFVLPPIVAELGAFVKAIPVAVANLESAEWFTALPLDVQATLSQAIDEVAGSLARPGTLAAIGGGALAIGVGVASFVSAGFVVVALTLYFLASLSGMKSSLYALAPARNRARLSEMTGRVTASVGSSLLGSVTLSAINAAVVLGLHMLLGLPYAALMAAIAFIITLVPLFGSVIFLVVASILALFSGPPQALIFAIGYLIYIQLESYVVTPRVMTKAISIPAALILIGAMVGATLLGVLGVLLALPLMATILLIIREVVVPKQDAKT